MFIFVDLKISSLFKEAAKIRGLEDEIQSLCSCEKELADVKSQCERLDVIFFIMFSYLAYLKGTEKIQLPIWLFWKFHADT